MTASTALRNPDRFYVDGQWVTPSSSATIDVIQPATEEIYLRVAEATEEDIGRAVTAASTAFRTGPWRTMAVSERAKYLTAFGDRIRARSEELGRIWTSETGVLHGFAGAVSAGVAGVFDYYASLATSFEFESRHEPSAGGKVGLLVREPVGVVGAIVPWNAPLALIAYKIAPALLAGCTVVLKASPEAPGEAYVIAEIAEDIGLPPGVINVLTADREASEALVRDERVHKITFTGSTAAGRRIGSLMGERIGRYTLELGGKSAAVVLDDYPVEALAQTMAGQAAIMTGQVCSSLTRVIVSRQRHDAVVEALGSAFAAITIGDPFDPTSQMGPLAMARQRDRVESYIALGRDAGATLVTGGARPPEHERGYYIQPTVFGNVDNSCRMAQEEIFGPVLSVIPATDESDAVRIANDTIYGLNASVFTDDVDRALEVARLLESGTVGHNAQRTDFGIAFGGVKQSGIGREGGVEGLLPFLESKTIILEGEPSTGPRS